jgi:Fe-S cluster assembly ATP-binding protein
VPDHVHVLVGGKVVRSGDKTLAQELEKKGYGDLLAELGISVPAESLEATA